MRHLTCHLQEVLRDPPPSPFQISFQVTRVNRYERGTEAQPQTSSHLCPPTEVVMYPCSCQAWACMRQLTLSHMDFNCGFWQMFVQPIAQFGAPGIQCHLLGVLEFSVRFWLSVFIRWIVFFPPWGVITPQCGFYLCMKVISVTSSASSRSWEPLPRYTCKMCGEFAEYCVLSSRQMLEFYPRIYEINSIIKNVLEVQFPFPLLSGVDGHVLTWFSLTTELQAAVSSVRHVEVLWGPAAVSCNVNTINTTCYSGFVSCLRHLHLLLMSLGDYTQESRLNPYDDIIR